VILRALMRLLGAVGLIALLGARRLVAGCFFVLFAMIVLFDALGRIARHVKNRLPTGEEIEAYLAQSETFLVQSNLLLAWDGLLSWEASATWIGAVCLLACALAAVSVVAAGRASG
jgi:1-acyl-sn-glycerol-3-phosphate acyltransferase